MRPNNNPPHEVQTFRDINNILLEHTLSKNRNVIKVKMLS